MSYFILMGRRIPKQAITGFKFQNETDNIRPFLSIRKVEYSRLNTEKGTYAHWLNCVTSISYNRYKQVMEVECNECTSKLFVDMIKSICNISEQVKSFVNPEQIKAIAESNEPILLLSNN